MRFVMASVVGDVGALISEKGGRSMLCVRYETRLLSSTQFALSEDPVGHLHTAVSEKDATNGPTRDPDRLAC